MSTYRIRSGDTLSALAHRYRTSVSAFMRANPQIRNANLIYTGHVLHLPGTRDEFVAHSKPRAKSHAVSGSASRGPHGRPIDIARHYLGWNASALKRAGNAVGRAMEDWVPNNVNCANFVSGVLQAAGQISTRQHSNSVLGLRANLDRDPQFRRVPLRNAQPGDVVSFKTPGGHHVVLFAGWKNGRPLFIGSNNVNPDGSQRVSYSQSNYPIISIHHFVG